MFLSTFPTGTVSSERLGPRTFPVDEGSDDGTKPANGRPSNGTETMRWTVDTGRPRPDADVHAEGQSRPATSADESPQTRPRSGQPGDVTPTDVDRSPDSWGRSPRRRGDFPDGPSVRLAELEHENAQLRAQLSKKEGDLQDVIDRYERVLARRNEARRHRNRHTRAKQSGTSGQPGLLGRLGALVARLVD